MNDEALEKLWKIKDDFARDCGNDLDRLFKQIMKDNKMPHGPYVDRSKREPIMAGGR